MAKSAPKTAVKSDTKALKPGRRSKVTKPTKAVKATAPAKKPVAVKAPVVSKDELRAQLEKAQMNRSGIFGGSNSDVDWSHDEQDNE